jgi:hypothetical protein
MKLYTNPGREQLAEAAEQLKSSERGRRTLTMLEPFLRGPASALDAKNRNALLTLMFGFYGSYPGTTLEVIEQDDLSATD